MAERVTEATDITAKRLFSAVRSSLFDRAEDVVEGSLLSESVTSALWKATETAFYEALNAVLRAREGVPSFEVEVGAFRSLLERESLRIFDQFAEPEANTPKGVRRFVHSRFRLAMELRGFGKWGSKLFEKLRIQPPEGPSSTNRVGSNGGRHHDGFRRAT
jgi:hypothetical protein